MHYEGDIKNTSTEEAAHKSFREYESGKSRQPLEPLFSHIP
jgi:hypothetical protein